MGPSISFAVPLYDILIYQCCFQISQLQQSKLLSLSEYSVPIPTNSVPIFMVWIQWKKDIWAFFSTSLEKHINEEGKDNLED